MEARGLNVWLFGHEQENVGLCGLGDEIKLLQDGALDILRWGVDDKLRVNIDEG